MPWHRGSKKWRQSMRRIHNEKKDKPESRFWWEPEPEPWEPLHVRKGKDRAYWKRRERGRPRRYPNSQWLNDNDVVVSARKRKRHRRHEIKPYERHKN